MVQGLNLAETVDTGLGTVDILLEDVALWASASSIDGAPSGGAVLVDGQITVDGTTVPFGTGDPHPTANDDLLPGNPLVRVVANEQFTQLGATGCDEFVVNALAIYIYDGFGTLIASTQLGHVAVSTCAA